MTVLIADSGSTKTDWALVQREGERLRVLSTCQTQGLNPLYATPADVADACQCVARALQGTWPDAIRFYGAGCAGERIPWMSAQLQDGFPGLSDVEVASDLLGACRALYGQGSVRGGVACIMGTGAVAARYDAAADAMCPAPSLGYILGDEGSGAWLGRHLLSDFLKGQMPASARALFLSQYGEITSEDAIMHVYRGPYPNRYLASFAAWVGAHLDDEYCLRLARQGIELFCQRNVARLAPAADEPIAFVGSVAYGLRSVIADVVGQRGWHLGRILRSPLSALVSMA